MIQKSRVIRNRASVVLNGWAVPTFLRLACLSLVFSFTGCEFISDVELPEVFEGVFSGSDQSQSSPSGQRLGAIDQQHSHHSNQHPVEPTAMAQPNFEKLEASTGVEGPSSPSLQVTEHRFGFGYISEQPELLEKSCSKGSSSISYSYNTKDVLMAIASVGFYTPRTAQVSCR